MGHGVARVVRKEFSVEELPGGLIRDIRNAIA